MGDLYGNELAKIYDRIYQGFIDYNEVYALYSAICKSFKANAVLEIACGSGNLATLFSGAFEDYLGLDASEHMLRLASEKCPDGKFVQGDMRSIVLPKKYQAVLITGRSTSYLLSDTDLQKTFSSVYQLLCDPAIFTFDCIDINKFIPYIAENPEVTHRSIVAGDFYVRESKWHKENSGKENLVRWKSALYKKAGNKKNLLGIDDTVFRVFSKDEIQKFLVNEGFTILNITDRKTYAFDTFVVTAQKGKQS